MSIALFTPTGRQALAITNEFPDAVHISASAEEDVFEIGQCRITCRYWTKGGDFVSRQILGCGTAVESGQLRCEDAKAVEERVYAATSVIGMVGPHPAVTTVAEKLARRFSGVLVDDESAVLF